MLGSIISSFFTCSNEEKNQPKQQSMGALVLSLWFESSHCCLYLGRDNDAKKFKTICNIILNLNMYCLINTNVLAYSCRDNKSVRNIEYWCHMNKWTQLYLFLGNSLQNKLERLYLIKIGTVCFGDFYSFNVSMKIALMSIDIKNFFNQQKCFFFQ